MGIELDPVTNIAIILFLVVCALILMGTKE